MWGFLRETAEAARKAGIDKDTQICRTGLDEYLKKIYPEVNDWIHDERYMTNEGKLKPCRPDYISKTKRIIVEFDGVQHYQSPYNIKKDRIHTLFYENEGYTVIRIPYFIQLSNKAIKELFGVDIPDMMFDETIPSLGPNGRNTPAFLCHQGIIRMAKDFARFPEQYKTNLEYLKKCKPEEQYLIEYDLLEGEYNRIISGRD